MSPAKPKLLDQGRRFMRTSHSSRRTEDSYCASIKRFILFHGKRHPREMGEAEVAVFLAALGERLPADGWEGAGIRLDGQNHGHLLIETPPPHPVAGRRRFAPPAFTSDRPAGREPCPCRSAR